MTLAEAVEKVVKEFDFTDDNIRNAVKEFLAEMGKLYMFIVGPWVSTNHFIDDGLKNDGAMMNQIPTYVTAVPNGTEKVS
jgi:hexokinase